MPRHAYWAVLGIEAPAPLLAATTVNEALPWIKGSSKTQKGDPLAQTISRRRRISSRQLITTGSASGLPPRSYTRRLRKASSC